MKATTRRYQLSRQVDANLLEPSVRAFARKMGREIGSDLRLNGASRNVIFTLVYNSLWDTLRIEIVRDRRRRR